MEAVGGSAFISKDYAEFCKKKINEIEYTPWRQHTGTGAVERAKQTPEHLIVANLENKIDFTESIN